MKNREQIIEGLLTDRLLGEDQDPETAALIEALLEADPGYRELSGEIQATLNLVGKLPQTTLVARPRRRRNTPMAIASGLGLAAAAAIALMLWPASSPHPPETAPEVAAPPPAPARKPSPFTIVEASSTPERITRRGGEVPWLSSKPKRFPIHP